MGNRRVRALTVAVTPILGLPLTPTAVRAQNVPLAQLLPDLILREITVEGPVPGVPSGSFSHVAHFSPIEANEPNNPVVGIVQGFNGQMATQFSTFPLGSSTGGLTYVFDDSVGTFRRGSSSFGPSFAERAVTIGRLRRPSPPRGAGDLLYMSPEQLHWLEKELSASGSEWKIVFFHHPIIHREDDTARI